jgi:hypothetical protein
VKDNVIVGESQWTTSSYCNSSACVEVMITADSVAVRDTKDRGIPALVYTVDEWRQFLSGVKDGEFDLE